MNVPKAHVLVTCVVIEAKGLGSGAEVRGCMSSINMIDSNIMQSRLIPSLLQSSVELESSLPQSRPQCRGTASKPKNATNRHVLMNYSGSPV